PAVAPLMRIGKAGLISSFGSLGSRAGSYRSQAHVSARSASTRIAAGDGGLVETRKVTAAKCVTPIGRADRAKHRPIRVFIDIDLGATSSWAATTQHVDGRRLDGDLPRNPCFRLNKLANFLVRRRHYWL